MRRQRRGCTTSKPDISTQIQINKVNLDKNSEDTYGDQTNNKEENTTMLMFMNVWGVPTSNHHPKYTEIQALV